MNTNEQFLSEYKHLEQELRYDGLSVLDYENSLTGNTAEKLKVCRIMRNYLSHNDTVFIAASREQVEFLAKCCESVRQQSSTAKDYMKRVKLFNTKTPIKDMLTTADKYGFAIIELIDNYYIITNDMIIHQLANNHKYIDIPKRQPKNTYITKMTRLEELTKNIYIITDNGAATGKYLGVLDMRDA